MSPEQAESDARDWAGEPVEGEAQEMSADAYALVLRHGYDCTHGEVDPVYRGGRWVTRAELEETGERIEAPVMPAQWIARRKED